MSPSELVAPTPLTEGTRAGHETGPLQATEGPEARRFCLAVIEEVFGVNYRSDWHADLDALAAGDHLYHPEHRGEFLVVRRDGRIIGTGGLRSIETAPRFVERFADRYPEPAEVGSVWRTYLDPDHRCNGIGSELIAALERRAVQLGYRSLYLHTSGDSPRSVAFWERQGYEPFATDDTEDATVHLDKRLIPEGHAGG